MLRPYAALADKYLALASLRRAHHHDATVASRDTLRALAREHPGALRELDAMPLETLDARALALAAVAAGTAPVAPWMDWCLGYHSLMRAALAIKRRVGRTTPSEALVRSLAHEAGITAGMPLDGDFVRAVAHPPEGRLNAVVFARLGAHLGVEPQVVWECLFPTRRGGPRWPGSPPREVPRAASEPAPTAPSSGSGPRHT